MSALRGVVAMLVAAALTAGLVVCSGLPYVADAGDAALIRLSWRAAGERIEECRTPSQEELAELPPHMRRPEICEGRTTPFQLAVSIDGVVVLEERIRPAGARQDRPVYVFREFPVSPGEHLLQVRFTAEFPEGADPSARAPLLLEETLRLAPRTVALVTYDDPAARLVLVPPPREAARRSPR